MKYIMMSVHAPDLGFKRLMPVIFPNGLVHSLVYNANRRSVIDSFEEVGVSVIVEIRSAGFISLTELICHGGSETLGVEAHPDDSGIIATFDYQGGLL